MSAHLAVTAERLHTWIHISHSDEDLALARNLSELLSVALDLDPVRICARGIYGCTPREELESSMALHEALSKTPVQISLLTEAGLADAGVLFELGARWALGGYIAPVLGAGIPGVLIPAPLQSNDALHLDNPTELNTLIVELSRELHRPVAPPERFERQIRTVSAGR